MKLLRLILAVLFLVSAIPMEAFCQDEHCAQAPVSCAVNCHHAISFNLVIPIEYLVLSVIEAQESFASYILTYEDPVLFSLKKPPIVLS